MNGAGIPCGPVLSVDEVFNHPLATELELAGTVRHTTLGDLQVLGRPADTGDAPWLHSAPPLLGEHSHAVLSDHGFSDAEIAGYTQRGIIAQR
ncbi:CoA transferase [Arthrobacter sp. APC 3897]|uniref:CoA transferase n=1 Tax=Arthrobacter sp. APC 3897 TaxID=3035204 RepID=UPI0033A56436